MAKRKWGDRKDAKLLRDLPALNLIMPGIMPNRADNEAFISFDLDLRPLDAYLAEKNKGKAEDKLTYFQLIAAAVGKCFILRPKMNRFICNNRVYEKNDVTVAFVVKKKFEDKAEEGLAYLVYDPDETIDSFHEKITRVIHTTRREKNSDTSTDAMEVLKKMPHFMRMAIVKGTLWLDKHGWAPEMLIGSDPNHASIFLSNLGSIGLECGYHHLVNWGTNSCFIVIGKKYMKKEYDSEGREDIHPVVPVGITLDERIADGYYYSGSVALVKELLAHPELLEKPASAEVEYSIRR
ncbi:MAG: 2-oxo acid dehydrogenase subunit E2 [Firmicutes bacterium]|nr:2-oxo acid dehydrogenase subunit E2 [Bacillota bacterium]